MSAKINVTEIILGHIDSLRISPQSGFNVADIAVFFVMPALIAVLGICVDFDINNEFGAILVNFGSIFTALLLSVLMLIYEQENKLDDKKEEIDRRNSERNSNDLLPPVPFFNEKKKLLHQLYCNICYCIIFSMVLVVIAALDSVVKIDSFNLYESYQFNVGTDVFAPISVFVSINLILTIVMIVKRMHALLVTR
jgi:hypothetical protein